MKIYIFASEIDTLVGENRSRYVDDAFQRVLARNNLIPKHNVALQTEKKLLCIKRALHTLRRRNQTLKSKPVRSAERILIESQRSFHKDLFHIHDISFVMMGCIDMAHKGTGQMVELKTRYKMLSRHCNQNERIQMNMYLWLSGENEMIFAEKYWNQIHNEIVKRDELVIMNTLCQLREHCLHYFLPFVDKTQITTNMHISTI